MNRLEPNLFNTNKFRELIRNVYGLNTKCVIKRQIEKNDISFFDVKNFFSGRKLCNMPFNFYPNILINDDEKFISDINIIEQYGNENNYNCIEIKSLTKIDANILSKTNIMVTSPFVNSILYLDETYELTLQKNYQKKHIKNIRTSLNKCNREGIQFKELTTKDELDGFFNVLLKLYRNKHKMICQPYQLYDYIYSQFIPNNCAKIFIATKNNSVIAGIVVLTYKDKAYYSWGATDMNYYHFGLNSILVDQLIQYLCEKKFNLLDFGTSPINDTDLQFFKNRWGCSLESVYYYYLIKQQTLPDYNNSFVYIRKFYPYMPLKLIKIFTPYVIKQLI